MYACSMPADDQLVQGIMSSCNCFRRSEPMACVLINNDQNEKKHQKLKCPTNTPTNTESEQQPAVADQHSSVATQKAIQASHQ